MTIEPSDNGSRGIEARTTAESRCSSAFLSVLKSKVASRLINLELYKTVTKSLTLKMGTYEKKSKDRNPIARPLCWQGPEIMANDSKMLSNQSGQLLFQINC